MASQYAQIADLQNYGLIPEAMQAQANAQLTAQLIAASTVADTYLRGRYNLPLLSYDVDLTMYVCWIAAYLFMSTRGYNPEGGADSIYRDRYDDAVAWLKGVERQAIHPNVQPSPTGDPTYTFPQVQSDPPRGFGGPCPPSGGPWPNGVS